MVGLKLGANAHYNALWTDSPPEENGLQHAEERRENTTTKRALAKLAVAEDLNQKTGSGEQDEAGAPAPAGLGALCRPGRLVELSGDSGSAKMSTAVAIVREAQRELETTAWVQPAGGSLFPPDLAEAGVDLESLIVVHVPRPRRSTQALELARAAELLLRSGAYGLVVVDMCQAPPPRSSRRGATWQARLLTLARQHSSRLVILTEKADHHESAGPLVNLRVAPRRVHKTDARGLRFEISPRVLKDKSGEAPTLTPERRRGPWGLA